MVRLKKYVEDVSLVFFLYDLPMSKRVEQGCVSSNTENEVFYFQKRENNLWFQFQTTKKVKQHTSIGDIEIMYATKQRAQFLPRVNSWVSLRNFS